MKKYFLRFLILFAGIVAYQAAMAQTQEAVADTIIDGKKCVYPSFKGGIDGWRRYLEGNLQYPKKAQKKNIQGVVRIEMTVDAKGNVMQVKALNDPGGGLSAEAERVIKEGPKWIPATVDGQPVSYKYVQSIIFQLQ